MKTRVTGGRRVSADLQQICPVQSLLVLQCCVLQVAAQIPSQHSGVVPLQSADWAQGWGQGV